MRILFLRGFTIVELLLSILLVSVIAGLAAPSFTGLIAQSRHNSTLGDMRGLFQLARSHALTTGRTVTICPLDGGKECLDEWSRPVSLFIDENRDGRPDDGRILRTLAAVSHSETRYSRTAGRGYFRFSPDGLSAGTLGSIVYCTHLAERRAVLSYVALSIGGRLRVQTEETPDGSMRLSWGATVTC